MGAAAATLCLGLHGTPPIPQGWQLSTLHCVCMAFGTWGAETSLETTGASSRSAPLVHALLQPSAERGGELCVRCVIKLVVGKRFAFIFRQDSAGAELNCIAKGIQKLMSLLLTSLFGVVSGCESYSHGDVLWGWQCCRPQSAAVISCLLLRG